MQDHEIGGAYVRRGISTFDAEGKQTIIRPGTHLDADAILRMPPANRRALIDSGALDVHPPAPAADNTLIEQLQDQYAALEAQHASLLDEHTKLLAELKRLKAPAPSRAPSRTAKRK